VAAEINASLAFGFDVPPGSNDDDQVGRVVAAAEATQAKLQTTSVVPIVHGSRESLPGRVAGVVERLFPVMVAVAERDLGATLFERIRTIVDIRIALSEYEVPLHLLGTGNPLSLALYALAGADSFDGLEWCQTIVDPMDGTLHHFSHAPLFASSTEADPVIAGLTHNLSFYDDWMRRVRASCRSGDLPELILNSIPAARAGALANELPELLPQP
jgi:queuine/archaeosine tRNA-ribosyltransferase